MHFHVSPSAGRLTGRVIGIYVLLLLANLAVWLWAALAFQRQPLLLGTAFLAYGFGLRHAVDADHIAAIDNVVRKLVQDRQVPLAVGFWFALGHSSVVILAAGGVAATASALDGRFAWFTAFAGAASTVVSAAFLFVLAAINVVVLISVWRSFCQVRAGIAGSADDIERLLGERGFLARLLRPLFRLVGRSWHMFPLGVLFGLGFDTSTEIALLGLSATQAAHGLPLRSMLVFPALFAAGMLLIDTTDGILMLGAYRWAFVRPMRKLSYNLVVTSASVVVAVLIGGIELLGLLGGSWHPSGQFWSGIGALNDNFSLLGFAVAGLFALAWIGAAIIDRYGGLRVLARRE